MVEITKNMLCALDESPTFAAVVGVSHADLVDTGVNRNRFCDD